jgi:hypothetical protein
MSAINRQWLLAAGVLELPAKTKEAISQQSAKKTAWPVLLVLLVLAAPAAVLFDLANEGRRILSRRRPAGVTMSRGIAGWATHASRNGGLT